MNASPRYLLIISILMCAAPLAPAQFELSWYTIDGGGGRSSTGGGFDLAGTIGQPDAASNPTLTGGTFELTGGFWPVANVCYCPGDLNGDGHRDGRDVQQFVACMISGGNCSCADVDQINGVNLADVAAFVNDLILGTSCP